MKFFDNKMEDALQNGVKETKSARGKYFEEVHDVLENGVKEIYDYKGHRWDVKDVIQNGVKETKQKKNALLILDTSGRELILESHLVVRDGVKETSHRQFLKTYDVKDTIQDGTEHDRWILDGCDDPVDEVLDNGVKETNYDTDNYTDDVNEVIREGVRTSHPRQYVGEIIIDKVIDNGVIETHDDVYHHKGRIDGVIKNGVKDVRWKIIPPKMINDVIDDGIKETLSWNESIIGDLNQNGCIDTVINNGVKETKGDASQNPMGKVTKVIKEGIKNPTA
jgi:hypothetical protein